MNGTIVPVQDLSGADRARMFSLLDAHFEGVTPDQFDHDLDEKTAAILLRDSNGVIQGFSSVLAYRSGAARRPIGVVSSGDTIVEAGSRGSSALARTWICAVRSLRESLGCDRTVWLLIVSGFRTYRFLPVFWRDYVPRPVGECGPDMQLLRSLAVERYGAAFDAGAGVVRLPNPQRLRPRHSEVPEGRALDPGIRYFLNRNPGHAAGDELVCLCDLRDDNLTAAGRRMVFGAGSRVSP